MAHLHQLDLPCFHVDAFALPPAPTTAAAFTGNPAAVVLCPAPLPDAACRALAADFNLSETGFVVPRAPAAPAGGGGSPFAVGTAFDLRWFTPTTEVALCGHGTLAAAHVLAAEAGNAARALTFHTLSGPLVVTSAHGPAPLVMRFPYNAPTTVWEAASGTPLEAALLTPLRALLVHALAPVVASSGSGDKDDTGVSATALQDLSTLLHSVHYSAATRKLVVRLADGRAGDLARLAPDVRAMHAVDQRAAEAALRGGGGGEYARTGAGLPPVTGVSVTVAAPPSPAPADGDVPTSPAPLFWSRYFSPWNGIPEDPVNGSSHTILAPYWARQAGLLTAAPSGTEPPSASALSSTSPPLPLPPGHTAASAALSALQLSARRGLLGLRVDEVADAAGAVVPALSSVTLSGACVTVYRGTLRL